MIDPGTNPGGETVEAYCRRRWGGSGWTHDLRRSGAKDGARFENWKWWPHTLKAHQLIEYCVDQNVASSDAVNQLLFRAEYERGENISEIDCLVEVGRQLGVSQPSELQRYLQEDQGATKVHQEIQRGRQQYRITGVPFFVIGSNRSRRPYGFSGAQDAQTFLEIFEELSSD